MMLVSNTTMSQELQVIPLAQEAGDFLRAPTRKSGRADCASSITMVVLTTNLFEPLPKSML